MNWGSLDVFINMGKAAPFVWGSYGVTAVLIVAELWLLSRRRKHTARRLHQLQQLDS